MNIAWHYWCGYRNKIDRYVKYLLVSIDSLLQVGSVSPSDVFVTLDAELFDHPCAQVIHRAGVQLLCAPSYPNYGKQIAYWRLLKQQPDIDSLVQIDCDTLITDSKILDKVKALQGPVNIDVSGSISLYDTIQRRNGQVLRGNNLFAVGTQDINPPHSNAHLFRYEAFSDYLKVLYNVNLADWVEQAKHEKLPLGFLYVLKPKQLPEHFFQFLANLNFFFDDDELGIVFAKFLFGLDYATVNSDFVNRANPENIIFAAGSVAELTKYSGIVHFPADTPELMEFVDRKIVEICR